MIRPKKSTPDTTLPSQENFKYPSLKKIEIKVIGNLILVWVLFLWFSHFSERIMLPARPPCPPQFVKLLISIVEKKDLNENYIEFYFSMGIVLVIFSFFWTVNDLVCVPPPLCGMSHFFSTPQLFTYFCA